MRERLKLSLHATGAVRVHFCILRQGSFLVGNVLSSCSGSFHKVWGCLWPQAYEYSHKWQRRLSKTKLKPISLQKEREGFTHTESLRLCLCGLPLRNHARVKHEELIRDLAATELLIVVALHHRIENHNQRKSTLVLRCIRALMFSSHSGLKGGVFVNQQKKRWKFMLVETKDCLCWVLLSWVVLQPLLMSKPLTYFPEPFLLLSGEEKNPIVNLGYIISSSSHSGWALMFCNIFNFFFVVGWQYFLQTKCQRM